MYTVKAVPAKSGDMEIIDFDSLLFAQITMEFYKMSEYYMAVYIYDENDTIVDCWEA